MSNQIRWVGMCGTLQKESLNEWLLNAVGELLPADVELEITNISGMPLYDDSLSQDGISETPPEVEEFKAALDRAEGIVIVSPELNYAQPGGLKNAIDWALQGEDPSFLNKPVALLGATPGVWGTVRMQQDFIPLFECLDVQPVNQPKLLIEQARENFTSKGQLKDEKAKDIIRRKLNSLKDLCQKCKEMLTPAFQA